MTLYRCTSLDCRQTTSEPNFSEMRDVDFEGHIQLRMIPTCPTCGSDCKRVSELTGVLADIATPVRP